MNRYIKYQAIILVSIVLFVLFGTLRIISLVKRINKESGLISELSLHTLNSRRFEKNFIERQNLSCCALQKETHQKLDSLISGLIQYSDFNKQDLIKASEYFNNYEAIFDSLANDYISIGINENSGFQDKMRKAIHEVETKILELHNYKLYCLLLQCQRMEKDFLSRNDLRYVDSFHNNLQVLSSSLAVETTNREKKSEIQIRLREYRSYFDSIVFLKVQIGLNEKSGLSFQMRRQISKFEYQLKILNQTIYTDGGIKIRNSFLLFGLLFVLFLIIVFWIYYFIIKRINNQLTQEQNEKKSYETALRNTEDRYRKLVELSPDGILVSDNFGKLLFANQNALTLLGCQSIASFYEKYDTILDLLSEEFHSSVKNYMAQVIESGIIRNIEYEFYPADKQPIVVELSVVLLEKIDENTITFMNVIRDITQRKEMETYIQGVNINLERKIKERTDELNSTNKSLQIEIEVRNKAEQILIKSEKKYKTIFDNAIVGMFRLELSDNLLLECNVRYANIMGFNTPQELVIAYNNVSECPIKQMLFEAMKPDGNTSKQIEVNFTNHLKQNIWLLYSLYYNIENNILEGIALDITEKKKAAIHRERILKRGKELNHLKTQFMSRISHEFRAPLTTISLNLQLMKKQDNLIIKETDKKYFKRIEQAVSLMTTTIQHIELLNKEDIVKLTFHPEIQNIKSFFEKYFEETNVLYENKIIHSILLDIREVSFDKPLLLYILNNLLSNAVKYSDTNSKVFCRVICTTQEIKITIEDKGIGITASDVKYIFEPYFRGLNVQNITGTGLGLSIVKRCLELHNGQISIKSKVGLGTKVVVKIPVKAIT